MKTKPLQASAQTSNPGVILRNPILASSAGRISYLILLWLSYHAHSLVIQEELDDLILVHALDS